MDVVAEVNSSEINTHVQDRYARVLSTVKQSAVNREITLVAVSKKQPVSSIKSLASLGHIHFAENYLSDALPKLQATQDYNLIWHFIGTIQSNKTRAIATKFDWVQSVDRVSIANRLNDARTTAQLPPLNVCVQVNIDQEGTKRGIFKENVYDFVKQIEPLPALKLRGLMSIPKPHPNPQQTGSAFAQLQELFESIKKHRSDDWDTLSMGMSSDYLVALEEGATMLRLGTTLFGPRL